jgi:serine/threonine-protein kinase
MADQRDRWPLVEALFHRAVDVAPGERASFVRSQSSDAAVVADVDALLAAHDCSHVLLDAPEPTDLPSGLRLGAYAVDRIIGTGGMATVYLAHRADRQFDRHVAVKLVNRGLAYGLAGDRFQIERRVLARLDHPQIARLLDAGVNEFGQPYLVMEWVDGTTLDAWVLAERPPIARRLDLWLELASAVAYAHSNLVIHRDIKPSNVLVGRDGSAKLVDFGIAKLIEGDDNSPTRTAGFTPRYASPEQIEGGPTTTATDVFGLGLLLCELVTDAHPFPDRAAGAASHGFADAPSLPATMPDDLAAIVRVALRREPARRYASVAEFGDDVRRYRRGEPVAAQPDTLRYRARRFAARHAAGLTGAALIGAVLVATVGAAVQQGRVAAAERDRANIEARKNEQVNAFLQNMLSAADPSREGRDVRVADVLDRAAVRLGAELAGQPEVEAALRSTMAATYQNLGLLDQAVEHAQTALALRERALGPGDAAVARSLIALGDALHTRGDYKEAEAALRRGLSSMESLGLGGTIDYANGLRYLGEVLNENGTYQVAERAHRQALDVYRKVLPADDERVAVAQNDLAVTLGNQQDFAAAEPLHRSALAMMRRIHGSQHLLVAQTLHNLAGALDSQRQYAEAGRLYEEALSIELALLGESHSRVVLTRTSLANLHWLRGEYEAATRYGRAAVASAASGLPPDHPLAAYAHMVLGQSLSDGGRPAEGEIHLRRALVVRRKLLPPDHWLLANTENVLGGAVARQGRFAEAERLLVVSYERLLADRGVDNDKTRDARDRVARLYRAWGRPREAARFDTEPAASTALHTASP